MKTATLTAPARPALFMVWIMVVALTGLCGPSWALDGTWISTTGGLWSASANWQGGTIADGAGFTANFTASGTQTVIVDSARTIGGLTFNTGTYTLLGASTNVLTLQWSGGTPTFNCAGGGDPVISAYLSIGQNFQKIGSKHLYLTASNSLASGKTFTILEQVRLSADQNSSFTGTYLLGNGSATSGQLRFWGAPGATNPAANGVYNNPIIFNTLFNADPPLVLGNMQSFAGYSSTITWDGPITIAACNTERPLGVASFNQGAVLNIGPNSVVSCSNGANGHIGFRIANDRYVTNTMWVMGKLQDGNGLLDVFYGSYYGTKSCNYGTFIVTNDNTYTGTGSAHGRGYKTGTQIESGRLYFRHPNALGANSGNNMITIFRQDGNVESRFVSLLADMPVSATLSNQQYIQVLPANNTVSIFTIGGVSTNTTTYNNQIRMWVPFGGNAMPATNHNWFLPGMGLVMHQAAGGKTILNGPITRHNWWGNPMSVHAPIWEKTGAGTVALNSTDTDYAATPVIRNGTLEVPLPVGLGGTSVLGDKNMTVHYGGTERIQLGGYRQPNALAPVRIATIGPLGAAGGRYYPNGGTNGIGRITNVANGSESLDLTTLAVGDRVLVLLEGNSNTNTTGYAASENLMPAACGIYQVTSVSGTVTLDRTADTITNGSWVAVSNIVGKVHSGKTFYLANQSRLFTNGTSSGTVQVWLEDESDNLSPTLNPALLLKGGGVFARQINVNSSPAIASSTLGLITDDDAEFSIADGAIVFLYRDLILTSATTYPRRLKMGQINGPAYGITKVGTGIVEFPHQFTYIGALTVSNGTVWVTGNGNVNKPECTNLVAAAGTIGGNGYLSGPTIVYGTLSPGDRADSLVGTLTCSNTLTFGSSGMLAIDLAGDSAYDVVSVVRTATVAGTLAVSLRDGFVPTNGQQFVVLTAAGIAGTFANAPSSGSYVPVTGGGYVMVTYNPSDVTLTYSTTGPVLDPYTSWATYYNLTGANAAGDADPDGDGLSNTNEFLAGFCPTNSAAALRILNIARSGNDIVVTYLGASGDNSYTGGPSARTNVLELSAGTANGSYSNNYSGVVTNILSGGNGLGTVVLATNINGATASPARYYRVRVLVP